MRLSRNKSSIFFSRSINPHEKNNDTSLRGKPIAFEKVLDKDEENSINRKKFFLENKISKVVSCGLVHSSNVERVDDNSLDLISQTDSLTTNKENLFLSTTIADCLPVFIFEKEKKAVALIHAGWRGLEKEIIKKTIKKIEKEFSAKPQNLLVAIGPSICQKHFEVKQDVFKKFKKYNSLILTKKGKHFLDLRKVAAQQLLMSNVQKNNIEISGECTFCSDEYFSYRRDKPKKIEAQIVVFGMI